VTAVIVSRIPREASRLVLSRRQSELGRLFTLPLQATTTIRTWSEGDVAGEGRPAQEERRLRLQDRK